MRNNQSYRRLALLILVPPLLVIFLCVVLLTPRINDFFNSPAYPDYLWWLRVTRELSDKGYPVHDVTVSENETLGFRDIDIQIGNLMKGEQRRSYELVKDVHSIVMDTFINDSSQPEPVDMITVMIIDYSSGSYTVSVDYGTVRKFYAAEISEQEYFKNWSYPENTPGITPP
ncbi:MAG: hypothetical protein KJZ77_17045 [Anaerolineales bacterium]|nr:hypothetical protein [Anaerolineales bacterium]